MNLPAISITLRPPRGPSRALLISLGWIAAIWGCAVEDDPPHQVSEEIQAAEGVDAGVARHRYFHIKVIDSQNRPVPCVDLTTTSDVVYRTDDNGSAAFYEPGLMGLEVWITPSRAGYKFHVDGLGSIGRRVVPTEGGGVLLGATEDPNTPRGPCAASTEQTAMLGAGVPDRSGTFAIVLYDEATLRGLPMVQADADQRSFVSDSNGLIAFSRPTGMGEPTAFTITSHGYEVVGGNPVMLTTTPGGTVPVAMRAKPDQIAQRLYRLTGAGIYRDSVLLATPVPIAHPLLNAQVMGQDTVNSTIYQGNVFWIFGDTESPRYPLGNTKVSGARSLLPEHGGLGPDLGVDLEYLGSDGGRLFAKPLAPEPDPAVPGDRGVKRPADVPMSVPLMTWLSGLTPAVGDDGTEQLFAVYSFYDKPMTLRGEGLALWNDALEIFEDVLLYTGAPWNVTPKGHAYRAPGDGHVYYAGSPPRIDGMPPWEPAMIFPGTGPEIRIPATAAALRDPSRYEGFSPFVTGSTSVLDRDPGGRLRYAWRAQTPGLSRKMVIDGHVPVAAHEQLFSQGRDVISGRQVDPSAVSVAWNPYRGRFTQIRMEQLRWSHGETWYLEADSPVGPWVYARKIGTHAGYTFYNPEQHPFFAKDGGREIYFQATYTAWLSRPPVITPRYDYNQIVYKLELDDPRLVLPVPVYDLTSSTIPGDLVTKAGLRRGMADAAAVFFAGDRAAPDTVPVYWSGAACRDRVLRVGGTPTTEPIFYALPADTASPPPGTIALHEYVDADTGAHAYSVDDSLTLPGFTLVDDPIALVWRNPMVGATLPVTQYLPLLLAEAGSDVCTEETSPGAGAAVTLDAARSNGTPVAYHWTWDEDLATEGSSTEASPTIALTAGQHRVELVITSADGETSRDTLVVDVGSVLEVVSRAAEDGIVRESRRGTGVGGAAFARETGHSALLVGDDPSNRQLRSVVSFDLSALPASATVVAATLTLTAGPGQASVDALGMLIAEVPAGAGFHGSAALQKQDFEAPTASAIPAAWVTVADRIGTARILEPSLPWLSRTAPAQLRLRYETATDGDRRADWIGFYSAEAAASRRPRLRIVYRTW